MPMNGLPLLLTLLLLGATGLAQNTGWLSPSADEGQFGDGPEAYAPAGGFAVGLNQVHRYGGFAVVVPGGSEIVGIEVLVRARRSPTRWGALGVELSGDGGMSWTTTGYTTGSLHPTQWRDHTLGRSTDLWGQAWTRGELGDGVFWVRVHAQGYAELDWVAVRVHYREGVTQALAVTPQLIDLGAITLAHYDAGYREVSPAQRITVSSGAPWSLHVAADAATWAYTGSELPPHKPCAHLEWRVSAFGAGVAGPQTSYVGLSTGQQKVAGGTAGTDLWLEVSLRLRVDYDTTVPGTYELRFTYTLTTP
ncbi:MAG: hypothetical protein BIP78_0830 [Candidatus Bipolaricaulis sibiricus]|uniref:Uncharacterized protein n=1 Tax=Bipolaricaulis sibiricus TaxID=2501609 RepID=A0A410FU62_BIPS1|nr:MAG: hypothetical protein BIP78_0830 [Candidatus Bipolaricaulis sibiricus]